MTHLIYGPFFTSMANKLLDVNSDTWKCALTTSSYTVAQDTHDFFDDVTSEVSSANYSAGGATISALSSTYTGATNVWNVDGTDATWTTVTLTARYGVTYDSTPGTAGTNPLMSYVDFGADQTASAANFSIVWSASGIIAVTVA